MIREENKIVEFNTKEAARPPPSMIYCNNIFIVFIVSKNEEITSIKEEY